MCVNLQKGTVDLVDVNILRKTQQSEVNEKIEISKVHVFVYKLNTVLILRCTNLSFVMFF